MSKQEKEERHARIQRLQNSGLTRAQMAEEIGLSERQLDRELKLMETQDKTLLRKGENYTQVMRDEVFEKTMDTYEVSIRAMRRTEEMVQTYAERLKEELAFDGDKCECCGRKAMRSDPLAMQSYFKGEDTMNNHLKFRAELLGQISNSPILVIQQQDEDLMVIIEEIAKEDLALSRRVWRRLLERSARRQRRFPAFPDIVEGNYRELPPGEYGES